MWFSCVVSWQPHRSNLKEMCALSSGMGGYSLSQKGQYGRAAWSLVQGLACHTVADQGVENWIRIDSARIPKVQP